MSASRIAELAHQIRDVLGEQAGRPLPPLPPPATEEEIAETEAELGYDLPAELLGLYSVAREGWIGALHVLPIDEIVDQTTQTLEIVRDYYEFATPDHWPGEPPQGRLVAFSASGGGEVLYYEVDGLLKGRVVVCDLGLDDIPSWGRLSDSLESCYEWQLAAAELGGFEVSFHENGVHCHVLPLSPMNEVRFSEFLQQVRPAIAAAGGTPAYFGVYDPPAGYITPTQ